MVERQLILVMSACIAVAGTLALAAWFAWEPPARVGIGEVDGMEVGAWVIVEGTVGSIPVSTGDVTVVVLVDGTGRSVSVFIPFPLEDVGVGSRLRVTGRVAIHEGSTELVVNDGDDLVVLDRPRSPQVDLADLLDEPWGFEGMQPVVHAQLLIDPVADLNGEDWWCLVSDSGSADGPSALALFGRGVDVDGLASGDELELEVAVRYDASSGFVYLEVLQVR